VSVRRFFGRYRGFERDAHVQDALGFARGYDVAFLTIVVLYTIATSLYWVWFGRTERGLRQSGAPTGETT
jgi:hypothetical protein